jgi:hypothetical protein
MIGRCMYIWKLKSALSAEGGVNKLIDKAKRAKLSSIWVKVADGQSRYENVGDALKQSMTDLVASAHQKEVEIWGWQVPHCPDVPAAQAEAKLFGTIASDFELDGLIMDAEGTSTFFHGGIDEARAYGAAMRQAADKLKKPLGISSNDIPKNIDGWLPKFNEIAKQANFNFPQTYYGASPSVQSRVDRAVAANAHLPIPFVPVGAGFIGTDEGGCRSAQDCAERANTFIRLCKDRGYQGYSFWHWGGAPLPLWDLLSTLAP